jgi:hypothetical protein
LFFAQFVEGLAMSFASSISRQLNGIAANMTGSAKADTVIGGTGSGGVRGVDDNDSPTYGAGGGALGHEDECGTSDDVQ